MNSVRKKKISAVSRYVSLAVNFDDVLDSVLATAENTLSKDEDILKLKRLEKSLGSLESK